MLGARRRESKEARLLRERSLSGEATVPLTIKDGVSVRDGRRERIER